MLGHGHSVHLVVYHVSYHSAALVPSKQVEHGNEVWVNYNKSTNTALYTVGVAGTAQIPRHKSA